MILPIIAVYSFGPRGSLELPCGESLLGLPDTLLVFGFCWGGGVELGIYLVDGLGMDRKGGSGRYGSQWVMGLLVVLVRGCVMPK